jgi:hypothetical protein
MKPFKNKATMNNKEAPASMPAVNAVEVCSTVAVVPKGLKSSCPHPVNKPMVKMPYADFMWFYGDQISFAGSKDERDDYPGPNDCPEKWIGSHHTPVIGLTLDGKLYVSSADMFEIAGHYPHLTMKEYMIWFGDLKIKLMAMSEPPPDCVQIPRSCFSKPDRMGLPGPLGYNIFGLHEGWDIEKVENYAKACGTPLYGRRYHDDGSLFVLPLAQLLHEDMTKRLAFDAAKYSINWVSCQTRKCNCNSHKRPLSAAGTGLIKGLGRESTTDTPEVSESRKRPHSAPGTMFIKGLR